MNRSELQVFFDIRFGHILSECSLIFIPFFCTMAKEMIRNYEGGFSLENHQQNVKSIYFIEFYLFHLSPYSVTHLLNEVYVSVFLNCPIY